MKRASFILFWSAVATWAQQPHVANGTLEVTPLSGTLESAMRAFIAAHSSPAWVGYAVPIVPGDRQVCGWDNGAYRGSHQLSLEGPTTLFVLYRVDRNAISKVRAATPDCDIDAGSLQVTWWTGVNAAASVRYLETLVTERLADSAMSAIALHKDAEADRALDARLAPDQPDKIREKAIMWLTVSRQRYEPVLKAAHDDKSAHVRGQALFWLAQGAQKKIAADAIAAAIENDPETDVKKKAVFALTQMPNGEGVPKLIEVAKTNRNAAVRKQALFWLGQSKDPRALQFIEELLVR